MSRLPEYGSLFKTTINQNQTGYTFKSSLDYGGTNVNQSIEIHRFQKPLLTLQLSTVTYFNRVTVKMISSSNFAVFEFFSANFGSQTQHFPLDYEANTRL